MITAGTPGSPDDVRAHLRSLLRGDVQAWQGLPKLNEALLVASIGKPDSEDAVVLGWYPAKQLIFADTPDGAGMAAYVRNGEVVMVEARIMPDITVLDRLGKPTAILPHEILIETNYVHEYLFAERGLVLSVAQPFDTDRPWRIVRSRGIPVLNTPAEFGPGYYCTFEDKEVWSA